MKRWLIPGFAVLLIGCTPNLSGVSTPIPETNSANEISRFYGQKLKWNDCGANQCTRLEVPMDYATPGGAVLSLRVLRNPATTEKVGTIFVNPGGPGAAGSQLASHLERGILTGFDIIGFDPRGTGKSSPLSCFDSERADRFLETDISPDDDREKSILTSANSEFGAACLAVHGELLNHISTVDTARDLDILRAVLGEEKLNYLGYSYGTYLGAVYGALFESRVGRMVLDSPIDLTRDPEVIQAQGFDTALNNFAAWCVQEKCGLGAVEAAVITAITTLFDELDLAPIPVGERKLTQSLAVTGVASALYGGRPAWPLLAQAVMDAKAGKGRALLKGADLLNGRGSDGRYDALFFAFPAISCLDHRDGDPATAWQKWDLAMRKAPVFGKYFGPNLMCFGWPGSAIPAVELRPLGTRALLVAASGDNATPYAGALNSARFLGSPLLTYGGEGHGTYGGTSKCVDGFVQRFLLNGDLPPADSLCPAVK